MESLLQLVDNANGFLWNVVLIVLLCGTGIFYTIKLKFIQVRKFGEGFKLLFGNLGHKGEKKAGEMTPFQSVATAIAAQVPVIWPVLQPHFSAAAPEPSSGCGSARSSEWLLSMPRLPLHRNIKL